MPYIAQRKMRVMGHDYVPGERVPAAEVGARSLRSLLSRGHVVEVDAEEFEAREESTKRPAKARA